MNRILFVDDETRVLDGLRRMLYPMRNQWEMVFSRSAREALALLSTSSFDLLITDIRMPEMNGVELLRRALEKHPQVMRIILSGTADKELTLQSVNIAHQYLDKPCDAVTLRATIERAFRFRLMLNQPGLKKLVSHIGRLPSMPANYLRLINMLQTPGVPLAEVGKVVACDLAMTAKILQLVNSAFFGLRRRFVDPTDAILFLGMDTVRALALTVAAFSRFQGTGRFSLETLQKHSLQVGTLAKRMAERLRLSKSALDDCLVGGLLHDVGKLVLFSNYPTAYYDAVIISQRHRVPMSVAECHVFGASHAHVGGYLLSLWGLPDSVTEVVLRHHGPADECLGAVSAAEIVPLADALINESPDTSMETRSLRSTGLLGKLNKWREMAGEILSAEKDNVK
jgi:putative nucleotidyltransferase with HDIG domain